MKKSVLAVAGMMLVALSGCAGIPSDTSAAHEAPLPLYAQDVPTEADRVPAKPLATPNEKLRQQPETTAYITTVDGDTIKTEIGTVRIIGIDTPERGECGYADAQKALRDLLSLGDTVTLELPSGQNDSDRYQRLLRYVSLDGVDLGALQIASGHAVARYDSADGYPAHPRQAAYREAQLATLTAAGQVVTPGCAAGPSAATPHPQLPGTATTPSPTAETGPPQTAGEWWTAYPSCAALKRNTAGHPKGPFDASNPEHAALYEWFAHLTGFRGDGDGDGLACE